MGRSSNGTPTSEKGTLGDHGCLAGMATRACLISGTMWRGSTLCAFGHTSGGVLWALVAKDKVDLVGGSTLVGPEHDCVGRRIGEPISAQSITCTQKLQVGTTALDRVLGVEPAMPINHE